MLVLVHMLHVTRLLTVYGSCRLIRKTYCVENNEAFYSYVAVYESQMTIVEMRAAAMCVQVSSRYPVHMLQTKVCMNTE